MAKSIIVVSMSLVFMFTSIACEFNSPKTEVTTKEKLVKARTPLFMEIHPVAEGEMAASPFPTKPVPKTASNK